MLYGTPAYIGISPTDRPANLNQGNTQGICQTKGYHLPQKYFEEKHIVQFGLYNSAVELHGS